MVGVGADVAVYFYVALVVYVAGVHLALDRPPRRVMYTAFAVFLLVGACVEEPDAFKQESVALKVLHFPFFAGVEAAPELVFAFAAVFAV